MPFQPVKNESVADAAAAQIRSLIAEDVLRPGDRLPPERELCDRMGVSRTSLREALKVLVSEGVLESRRGSGLSVSENIGEGIAAPIRSLIETKPEALDDFLAFRAMLEGETAAEAARLALPSECAAISTLLEKMTQAATDEDHAGEAALDIEFHMAIIEASRNIVAVQVMRSLLDLLRRSVAESRALIYGDAKARSALLEQHRKIAAAITSGDAGRAREEMRAHLDFVRATQKEKRAEAQIAALAERKASWAIETG